MSEHGHSCDMPQPPVARTDYAASRNDKTSVVGCHEGRPRHRPCLGWSGRSGQLDPHRRMGGRCNRGGQRGRRAAPQGPQWRVLSGSSRFQPVPAVPSRFE
eukprot:1353299-Alexandrium_andersonii.AAC.1